MVYYYTKIYTGDSRPRIPPRDNGVVSHGLNLEVFGFSPTTHAQTNTKQVSPRSSRAVRHLTHVCLHAQTAVDAGDIRTRRTTVILITGKMVQVLVSPLYICGSHIDIHRCISIHKISSVFFLSQQLAKDCKNLPEKLGFQSCVTCTRK